MRKTISAAFAGGLILALGACGADDKTAPAPAPTQKTSSSNDFCKDFAANGGDATTLGPFQAFEAKEDLAKEIDDKLAAMDEVEPPTELADAWKRYRSYYGRVKAAVDKLPQHGHLSDPELLRYKIEDVPAEPQRLATVYGIGYRYDRTEGSPS